MPSPRTWQLSPRKCAHQATLSPKEHEADTTSILKILVLTKERLRNPESILENIVPIFGSEEDIEHYPKYTCVMDKMETGIALKMKMLIWFLSDMATVKMKCCECDMKCIYSRGKSRSVRRITT